MADPDAPDVPPATAGFGVEPNIDAAPPPPPRLDVDEGIELKLDVCGAVVKMDVDGCVPFELSTPLPPTPLPVLLAPKEKILFGGAVSEDTGGTLCVGLEAAGGARLDGTDWNKATGALGGSADDAALGADGKALLDPNEKREGVAEGAAGDEAENKEGTFTSCELFEDRLPPKREAGAGATSRRSSLDLPSSTAARLRRPSPKPASFNDTEGRGAGTENKGPSFLASTDEVFAPVLGAESFSTAKGDESLVGSDDEEPRAVRPRAFGA